jgi:hypothetical protein
MRFIYRVAGGCGVSPAAFFHIVFAMSQQGFQKGVALDFWRRMRGRDRRDRHAAVRAIDRT